VRDKKHKYLLRIHRNDYHTKEAIMEELVWLEKLANEDWLTVQKSQKTRQGEHIVSASSAKIPRERYCVLLSWLEGKISYPQLSPEVFSELGYLVGKLQNSTKGYQVKHRKYWTLEGLLGANASMGSLNSLEAYFPKQYKTINAIRSLVIEHIKQYSDQNQDKLGLIHADLHFGNLIYKNGRIKPIDFDDCGLGYYMYDLAVILDSAEYYFQKNSTKNNQWAKECFFDSYCREANLSLEDIKILPYFKLARQLVLLGWLYLRKDNPVLVKSFHFNLKRHLKTFKKALREGPDPI
jgi:Ser/Thr protein kinase RdoA (MazF antagonist)